MAEAAQTYLTLGTESEETDTGFYNALNYIRENANTQYGKGRLFERLIRSYLLEDPFYQKRFSEVYLWSEWAERRPEFDSVDLGIDLVAEERDGGYCAIQCKCYAENARISSADLDTFAGIFLARLLQSNLIQPSDLERKYRVELHANEIVLLAYYIAAVNIEEAFRGQRGEDSGYEPFNGIVLTDTFNLSKGKTLFPKEWLPDNNERVEHQQQFPIQVIVGNPPWSAGQRSATDDNPNVEYPVLEERIAETYAEYSTVTNKNSLYDTYKMAIRWASDRIDEQGVIAFITNGSWIDGNVDSGVRACLAEEFNSIHVLNLQGNQRTQGEVSRREGGKVFGSGSRAPVAITLLVKNPNATHEGCKIQYRDIGDYLTREEKLDALTEAESIKGFGDWETIKPNKHYDWIGQRSDVFAQCTARGFLDHSLKEDCATMTISTERSI